MGYNIFQLGITAKAVRKWKLVPRGKKQKFSLKCFLRARVYKKTMANGWEEKLW